VLRGSLANGAFNVIHSESERALLGSHVRKLLIEAYVERSASGLRLGSGLPLSGDDASLPLGPTGFGGPGGAGPPGARPR